MDSTQTGTTAQRNSSSLTLVIKWHSMRAATTSVLVQKLREQQDVKVKFYLKHGDGTYCNQDHYCDIYFRCQSPAVVVVVMPVILFRMIQHVVIIFTCFFILQDDMKNSFRFKFPFHLLCCTCVLHLIKDHASVKLAAAQGSMKHRGNSLFSHILY